MHLLRSHALYLPRCWNLSPVTGLEAKSGLGGGSWEAALAYTAAVSGEAATVSAGNAGLILSDKEWRVQFHCGWGTYFPWVCEVSMGGKRLIVLSLPSSGLPTHPYSNLQYPVLPKRWPCFNSRHTARLEVRLVCSSSSHRMRLYISVISPLWLQETRVSFRACVGVFRLLYSSWGRDVNPWTHPFPSLLCPVTLGATSQISLYSLVFQKFSKISYSHLPPCFS